MAQLIDIKVPNMVGSAGATVTRIFARRGEWVDSGKIVAMLAVGAARVIVNVVSPGTGVIMEILVSPGQSVPQGTVLIRMKAVNGRRPDFQTAWGFFSTVNVPVLWVLP